MPIEFQHQPQPFGLVANTAYTAGAFGGLAQRRSEVERLELAYDQMRENRYNQMVNLWSQNQAQQAQMARQSMQNMFSSQMAQQQAAQEQQAYQQQQRDRMNYLQASKQFDLTGDLTMYAHQRRAALEEAIGGVDTTKLNDEVGMPLYHKIQQRVQQIDQGVQSGSIGVEDYIHGMNEVANMASGLSLPRSQRPVRDLMAEADQNQIVKKDTGEVWTIDPKTNVPVATGTYQFKMYAGQPIPIDTPFVDFSGDIAEFNSQGEKTPYNQRSFKRMDEYSKIKQQVMSDLQKDADNITKRIDKAGSSMVKGDNPATPEKETMYKKPNAVDIPSWYTDEKLKPLEIEKRFNVAWRAHLEEAYRGVMFNPFQLEKQAGQIGSAIAGVGAPLQQRPPMSPLDQMRLPPDLGQYTTPPGQLSPQEQMQLPRGLGPQTTPPGELSPLEQMSLPPTAQPGTGRRPQTPGAAPEAVSQQVTPAQRWENLKRQNAGSPESIKVINAIQNLYNKYGGKDTTQWTGKEAEKDRELYTYLFESLSAIRAGKPRPSFPAASDKAYADKSWLNQPGLAI